MRSHLSDEAAQRRYSTARTFDPPFAPHRFINLGNLLKGTRIPGRTEGAAQACSRREPDAAWAGGPAGP